MDPAPPSKLARTRRLLRHLQRCARRSDLFWASSRNRRPKCCCCTSSDFFVLLRRTAAVYDCVTPALRVRSRKKSVAHLFHGCLCSDLSSDCSEILDRRDGFKSAGSHRLVRS
uniref:Uncharacterized protein n=1 Tax=Steinernema glaseri TaxID=37863 RepID=A0A1I7Z5R5_9BILA